MKESFVTSNQILYCMNCGEEIIRCKQCGYKFMKEDFVNCDIDKHFCEECKEGLK